MRAYIVNCSNCGTANRIRADKEGEHGRCGNCRAELLPLYYQPQQMADSNFDDFIANYQGPVLAEFWATW